MKRYTIWIVVNYSSEIDSTILLGVACDPPHPLEVEKNYRMNLLIAPRGGYHLLLVVLQSDLDRRRNLAEHPLLHVESSDHRRLTSYGDLLVPNCVLRFLLHFELHYVFHCSLL